MKIYKCIMNGYKNLYIYSETEKFDSNGKVIFSEHYEIGYMPGKFKFWPKNLFKLIDIKDVPTDIKLQILSNL